MVLTPPPSPERRAEWPLSTSRRPIYYVNAAPHIGHAYTSLAADTHGGAGMRCCGDDTFLLTGTDEHGLKIAQAARDAGVTPQAHADTWSRPFREMSPTRSI
jgi:methionyl-tRNA synthetase